MENNNEEMAPKKKVDKIAIEMMIMWGFKKLAIEVLLHIGLWCEEGDLNPQAHTGTSF